MLMLIVFFFFFVCDAYVPKGAAICMGGNYLDLDCQMVRFDMEKRLCQLRSPTKRTGDLIYFAKSRCIKLIRSYDVGPYVRAMRGVVVVLLSFFEREVGGRGTMLFVCGQMLG